MTRSTVVAGVLVMAAAVPVVMGQTTNPQIGTWKMNMAKSKFSSGTGFKSATSKIEGVSGGVKHTVDSVYADGTSRRYEYTTTYDGKDVPMRGPFQGNTIAVTRIDSLAFETVQKTNGKVSLTTRFAVSRDGRTLTGTSSGVDPDGVKFTNVAVYDKLTLK